MMTPYENDVELITICHFNKLWNYCLYMILRCRMPPNWQNSALGDLPNIPAWVLNSECHILQDLEYLFQEILNNQWTQRERERQKKKGKVRKTNEKVPAFADKQLLAHHGYETSFLKNI